MKSGQFVVGMVNGNIESYESLDLVQLLPNEKLATLWELSTTRGIGIHNYINYDERVIAKSVISQTEPDKMGRKGTLNHTVIFKFDLCVMHDGLPYSFNPVAFQEAYLTGKLQFNISMPELQNPLPKPEWG